ncbi:MAG: D-Ala-D-Ala carboxypeptidase family metallohydrolase, partial [Aliihoeflea sp.]
PGLARLAPNGLLKQHDKVEVGCFRPELVAILRAIENRFGQKVVVTSGYRSPEHNRRVRGARASQHMSCAAADIHVPGVHKMKVAEFVRSMPRRGGVGTSCHTEAIHVDTGPERDWNWRCRRRG